MSAATLESPSTNGRPEITIDGIGPIEGSFFLDLSSGPGVYMLRGRKAEGKSTTISCIELLAGNKVDITLNDRRMDGRITGFGSSIPITRARLGKRKGEFEANALDAEKFTISDVIDPPIKDPVAADRHRIKAIAALLRTKSSPSDYYSLVGGKSELEAMIKPSDLQTDDPVLLASRIKTACDAVARNAESLADRFDGQAQACLESVNGLDLDQPSDSAELATAVDSAVAERARLKTLADEAARSMKLHADAQEKLARTKESYKGPTVARAQAMQEQSHAEVTSIVAKANELREQLRAVEAEAAKAHARAQQASAAMVAARQHAELISQMEDLINRGVPQEPTPDEIDYAERSLDEARARQELGVRIRDGKRKLEESQKHMKEADTHRMRAEFLRAAAASTFDVLIRSVKMTGLSIETVNDAPRLVIEHTKRGRKVLYAELSDGERVFAAINLLAPTLESPGVLPISQRVCQDLPNKDWETLDQLARDRGIFIFGALVDDGDLRVERFGE